MRFGICKTLLVAALGMGMATVGAAGQEIQFGESQPAPKPGAMHMEQGKSAPGPLRISFGDRSEEFSATVLAGMPHVTVNVYNEHAKVNQTFSGVPLISLLTKVGVVEKPRGKDFRLYLVAQGADGYQVVYSVGEVTPDVRDGTTIVADSVDGKPLTDNGVFQLVTTGEKRPARWVRNLVSIRAMTAQ
jgi:hypothetical protein